MCFISRQMGRRWRSLSQHCIPPVGVWEAGFLGKWSKILSSFPSYYMFTSQVAIDISSSICHQFDVEIPGGKFVEITFILNGESTRKFDSHQFDVDSTFKIDEISMTSPRGFLYVVSTSNQRNFCTRYFHSIIF